MKKRIYIESKLPIQLKAGCQINHTEQIQSTFKNSF